MNDSETNVLSTCDCVNVCLWACLEVCLQSAYKTKVTYMSRFLCKTVTFPFFIISPFFFYDSHKVWIFCEGQNQGNKRIPRERKLARKRLGSRLALGEDQCLSWHHAHQETKPTYKPITSTKSTHKEDKLLHWLLRGEDVIPLSAEAEWSWEKVLTLFLAKSSFDFLFCTSLFCFSAYIGFAKKFS